MRRVFRRTVTADSGVSHPAVTGLRVESVRDARGFELGVVMDAASAEATMAARISDAPTMSLNAVADWTRKVRSEKSVFATCASLAVDDEEKTAVLWLAVAAETKAERKDPTDFLTRLARFAPVMYDSADSLGMDAKPMSAREIATWTSAQLVGPQHPAEFPPRAGEVSEGPAALFVDSHVTVSFEVVVDDVATDVMEKMTATGIALSALTRGAVAFRFGAWSRIAKGAHNPPRRVGVVSIIAGDNETAEDAAWELIAHLSAAERLRVRRFWHRQAMGAGASLGAGVMGWQRLEVAE